MTRNIMLIPKGINIELQNTALALIQSIRKKNISINLCNLAIALNKNSYNQLKKRNNIIFNKKNFNFFKKLESLSISRAAFLIQSNKINLLIEDIISYYYKNFFAKTDITIVKGLISTPKYQFMNSLNYEIAKILNAEIILVISLKRNSLKNIKNKISFIYNSTKIQKDSNILGMIVNTFNFSINFQEKISFFYYKNFNNLKFLKKEKYKENSLLSNTSLPILAYIPWYFNSIPIKVIDICKYLNAKILNVGKIHTKKIESVAFCIKNISNIFKYIKKETLLIISCKDIKFLLKIFSFIITKNTKINSILLTEGKKIHTLIVNTYITKFKKNLPIFMINKPFYKVSLILQKFNISYIEYNSIKNQNYIQKHINKKNIISLICNKKFQSNLSPHIFKYKLILLAKKEKKSIILPEGYEPRIIKAATICAKKEIAKCILLGTPDKIYNIAKTQGINLHNNITIINPKEIRENYVERLVYLRKDKGMTAEIARKKLKDNVVLGTMMLEKDEVDGLVSGAINTTANTIRPALQLIKTSKKNSLISSIFFMLFPKKVLIYGDCAININPTSEQIAKIAIQSAESAKIFGIEPRVALISYSTGNSGKGEDVKKIKEAFSIAKNEKPDLIIDGPLQYDAAIMKDVAKIKAPNSPVAGKATVFIFPDLNTGNTTYKAVQRSANLISIGPMLQGMKKPVNDLSRGALVEDIVYTIAITAIQTLYNK